MENLTAFVHIAISLVMAATEALQSLPAVCPPDWLAWQDSCYILLPDKMNWFQALKLCDRPGSSLLIPDSQEEQDFIWHKMKDWVKDLGVNSIDELEVWIGCTKVDKTEKLMCLNSNSDHIY